MKIPEQKEEREHFFWEVVTRCFESRDTRSAFYRATRNYYLYGADEGNSCRFNKINPHIDLLTSYLFAAETTKFSVKLDEGADRNEIHKLRPLSRRVNDEWHRGNSDMVFMAALEWALVKNSTFIKLIPKVVRGEFKGVNPYIVMPEQMGVYREDKSYLDRQEAIAMRYTITKSQLARELDMAGHKKAKTIVEETSSGRTEESALATMVQRVVLSQSTPNLIGNVNWQSGADFYRPTVNADMAEMYELWVWDDDINDYRTITMAEPGICIYDRPNIFLPPHKDEKGNIVKTFAEHPFVQVCPNPLPDYLWGASEVAKLIGLQENRERRTRQIDELLDRQARPPKAGIGMMGVGDEILLALNTPDGFAQFPDPMSKIQEFKPDISGDLFERIHQLDSEFLEASGISNIMKGMGESGVRSKGQTSELARLGAARIKKRAMIIEDSLEKMASMILQCIRLYDADTLKDDEGKPFIAEQFTQDFAVKVDAHSNSPIFVEDQRELAFKMLEARMITRESAIEIVQPPQQQQLLEDLKKIEASEKEAQQQEMAAEVAKKGGGLQAVK